MQIHRLIAFSSSAMFNEARSAALDLDLAASLLLDMLNISTTLPDYLSTKVKSGNWFEVDRKPFFGPFALWQCQLFFLPKESCVFISYTAIFITLHWLRWFSSTESPFIDQIW